MTPADAELFVETLMGHVLPDMGITNADGSQATRTVADFFEYLDLHNRTLLNQISALSAQVTALSAAVTALSQSGGTGTTPEQVHAAVSAALTAAGHTPAPAVGGNATVPAPSRPASA